ncbi:hypothetical protein AAC387_Pa08g0340 [Persea americana]
MAVDMDQQQSFKHFCRICKKGFGCGRALGGHMRAHGIGDEAGHVYDDDPAADWDDKLTGNASASNKRMYALRTNPNRFKSCRSCENCGKEFSSWKSFFEHGKCSSDDAESLVSSPGWEEGDDGRMGCGGGGWSKGKRTRRVTVAAGGSISPCPSSEEEDLANCLVMLSTARVDPLVVETEESCASADKDEERRHQNFSGIVAIADRAAAVDKAKGVSRGLFECKACKKVFNSHQALGGHRASHKKVKGCFAAKLDDLDEGMVEEEVITHDGFSIQPKILPLTVDHHDLSIISAKKKSRVHECSICHRVFPSGQALGGHKRCHWVTSNSPESCSVGKFQQLPQRPTFNKSEPLDLNLPAPIEDPTGVKQDNQSSLQLQLPTGIYLQQWSGVVHPNDTMKEKNNSNSNNIASSSLHLDEEGDGKVKLAKLSDLKDMNLGGESSPWLQVGIGSAANGSNDP